MQRTKKTSSKKPTKKIVPRRNVPYNRNEIQRYIPMPIEFKPNAKQTYERRYVTPSAGNTDFSITDLISSKIIAATAVLGYSPHYALRLARLRLWGPVATIGTPVTVSVFPKVIETDTNCLGDLPVMLSDTSLSIDKPAFIEWAPSKGLPAGSWHYTNTTTTNLFKIAYPQGAVLELVILAVENIQQATLGFTSTLVGASPGGVYCRAVSTNFLPVSVNTI